MSIDIVAESGTPQMESIPRKFKSEKKHKSKERKKRKRDHEDVEDPSRPKSKKPRAHEAIRNSSVKLTDGNAVKSLGSPFHTQTASIYLPLAPISQRQPLEGICAEHISPLILTYYPPLKGVILSYSQPRMSERPFEDDGDHVLIKCIDEYGVGFAWVTAEFLLFMPVRGGLLEGYINLQNEGHLGLVCWNLFNASIERKRLPKDWKWVGVEGATKKSRKGDGKGGYAEEGIGHFIDGNGSKVEETISFRVKDVESSYDRERGFLSIEGTMLDEEAEMEVLKQEHISSRNNKDFGANRLGGVKALGATSLVMPERETQETDGSSLGRRTKYQISV